MPKINTYTDNATIEDVHALLTYDPAGNGATKLTTFARIASWISTKLSALTKKTSIASTDQLVMVDGAASPVVTKRIDYNVLAKAIIEQYASSSLAGANQSVKTAIDALNSNVVKLNGSTAYASNVDPDSLTDSGVYHIGTSASHSPTGSVIYGLLDVMSHSGTISQVFYATTGSVYYRNKSNSSSPWGDWRLQS